jgi:hypothetical protein
MRYFFDYICGSVEISKKIKNPHLITKEGYLTIIKDEYCLPDINKLVFVTV